jgi:pseudolysin
MTTASVLNAATPWSLSHVSLDELKRVILFEDESTKRHKLSTKQPPNSLRLLEQHTDEQHVMHRRLQQYYEGFPVWGGQVMIHQSRELKRQHQTRLNGLVFRDIELDLGEPSADFVLRAEEILHQVMASYTEGIISEESITPLVYIDDSQRPYWAYRISFLMESEHDIPKRPVLILDAKTLKPFNTWNDIKTAYSMVKGQGFGGNAYHGKLHYDQQALPYLDIKRDAFSGLCVMENQYVSVLDMLSSYAGVGAVSTFDCSASSDVYWTGKNQDGYDEMNGAYSPTNDALYVGTIVQEMYEKWYGVHALEKSRYKPALRMRVHYGKQYENAFWDGKQMTFGDGGDALYPLVSLDVGAHEISHGFTEQHSDLVYSGQSGGMNEAFSDMAAQAAEYYAKGKNSWSIGAGIIKNNVKHHALRYMDKPTQDGKSIERADQYYKGLDVHHSSGVYNKFFYELSNQSNWNPRLAFHVMLKANMDYWTPTSTFVEGACGVLWATEDLKLPLDAVKQAFLHVAIDTSQC